MKAFLMFFVVTAVCCLIYVLGSSAVKTKAEQQLQHLKDSLYVAHINATANIRPPKLRMGDHTCIDSTHNRCDGECECDGMNCWILKRDYEVDIYMDTLWLWDGPRLVGRYTTNWRNQIDTIILKDNQ